MDSLEPLFLELWREVSRREGVDAFAAAAAAVLSDRLPLRALRILSVDLQGGQVLAEAIWPTRAGAPVAPRVPFALDSRRRDDLAAWCRRGRPAVQRENEAVPPLVEWFGLQDVVAVAPLMSSWLALPLGNREHGAGVLVLGVEANADLAPWTENALAVLAEPFDAALEKSKQVHELQRLRHAAEADRQAALARLGRDSLTDTIVGCDAGLRQVMERVLLVAPSDMPVLIFGETGSGKEVIARAIHVRSRRAGGPFLRVNCGAIAPELLDSELFGHEKGAFTGATALRRGWFERAAGGTLLLDEIAELPPPAQVRLLRVLQDGTFERVGGERSVRVSVRIVAATHRDLPALVQAGAFREDLWYRIAGMPIVLPPLRERREDIAPLADHFARRAARRFGLRPQAPTAADLALLTAYDWPGNIRELASVIDRAAILGEGQRLQIARSLGGPASSGRSVGQSPRPAAANAAVSADTVVVAGELPTLDQAVRRHIEVALSATHGRIEGVHGAARLLQVNPHTLRARMRKLGIDWAAYR